MKQQLNVHQQKILFECLKQIEQEKLKPDELMAVSVFLACYVAHRLNISLNNLMLFVRDNFDLIELHSASVYIHPVHGES